MPTLGKAFERLAKSRGMTQKSLARACGCNQATPWKIMHELPVRWETLHSLLTVGLQIPVDSPDYKAFQTLWLDQHQKRAESAARGKGRHRVSKPARTATDKFRKLLHEKSEEEIEEIYAAAERAAKALRP